MPAIWKDIEINWQGEAHIVRPSIDFLNYIEQRDGMSLSKMLVRLINNDLPSGAACQLIAQTLKYAGCDVTAEQVFAETGGIGETAVTLAGEIITACLPAPKTQTTTAAPAKKKRATGAGRKSTA